MSFFLNHIFLFKSCHSGPLNKRQTIIISGDLGTHYMNITQKILIFFLPIIVTLIILIRGRRIQLANRVSFQDYEQPQYLNNIKMLIKIQIPVTEVQIIHQVISRIAISPHVYIQHAGRTIRTIKTRKGESLLHAPVKRVKAQWGVFHSDVRSACERSQVPLLLLQQRALHWACSNTAGWHGNNRNTRLSKRTSEPHLPSLSSPPAIPWGHSLFLSLYMYFRGTKLNMRTCLPHAAYSDI